MDAPVTSRSEHLFDAAKAVLVDGYARPLVVKPFPHFIDRGEGCWVWDVDGNRRIDFTNNFSTLIHGHCHPEIVRAVTDQAARSACSTSWAKANFEVRSMATDSCSLPSAVRTSAMSMWR